VWLLGARVSPRSGYEKGGEILSVRAYRDEMGEQFAPGSNSF
jgi:hypothetical protein